MLTLGVVSLDNVKERWLQLCELAAKEQDPTKLLEFVAEINRLLEEKEGRLKSQRVPLQTHKPPKTNKAKSQ